MKKERVLQRALFLYEKHGRKQRTACGHLEVPPRFELGNEGFADLYSESV